MVKIDSKKVPLEEGEIIIGKRIFHRNVSPFITTANINPGEYALIQEGEQANSAISMKQGFNGKKYLDTHVEVLISGLVIPRAKRFLTHLRNVNQALNNQGVLYDANGELIKGGRLVEYANLVNHNCWVWLGESFDKSKDKEAHLGLDVITVTGLENGKPVFNREPLQPCLSEDCYAELESVNEQGFLTKRASIKRYKPDETVYSRYPRTNSASSFYANPDFAYFSCNCYPQFSYSWLGVFAMCAEGARAENSADNK